MTGVGELSHLKIDYTRKKTVLDWENNNEQGTARVELSHFCDITLQV